MPWTTKNGVAIGVNWTDAILWRSKQYGATRLDVYVNQTDALVQFLEVPQSAIQDDQSEEVLIRQGFNSIPVETPFYAVRFKVWSLTLFPLAGTVDVTMVA